MVVVWACGSNGRGQLGDGSLDDRHDFGVVFESAEAVKRVASGGNHSFILLGNGELFACGDNSNGQCVVDSPEHTFVRVPGEWADVSCGFAFTLLVNSCNELYSCGSGGKGELGNGLTQCHLTKVMDLPSPLKSIHSCLDHSVLVLRNGDIYGFGNASNGKLLILDTKRIIGRPTLIGHGDKVALGKDFTIVERYGQLSFHGKDRFGIRAHLPVEYDSFQTMFTSLHYTHEGRMVSIGNETHGQLQSLAGSVWCVGSEHGLAVLGSTVRSWGWGEHGNCPTHEFDHGLLSVYGGWATSWVVQNCGKV